MRVETGAWRGPPVGPISILVFGLGAVTCLWMIWRGARTGHLGAGWAGGLGALLAMSALLSAQFAAWMAPAAGMAWARGTGRRILDGVAVFLTNLDYKSFAPLLRDELRGLYTSLLRNACWSGSRRHRATARTRAAEAVRPSAGQLPA